jgi:acetyl-CoA carboxylase biotin carboxyl carrier protein
MSGSSSFTNDDVEEILRVVDQLGDVEVKFETANFKLHVRKGVMGAPASAEAAISVQAAPTAALSQNQPAQPDENKKSSLPAAGGEAGTVAIRAPMLGRFYRAPSPSEPAYVEAGKHVGPDDPVCMIEVMKLFRTVNAGIAGTIVSIAVNDGDMIEYDQPLFFVKPD